MSKDGLLSPCESAGCDWKCCNYGSDGHIIMLPNEYEKAEGSLDHLKIIKDDYMGGKHIKCTAKDTATCDNGYKPIQCKIYPLWVRANGRVERSLKCPLMNEDIRNHTENALKILKEFTGDNNIDEFLEKAEVNMYEKIEKKEC